MTVRLEATIKRFIGLSTDTKPYVGFISLQDGTEIKAVDLPVGSSFLATDTNEVWHWDGREWVVGNSQEVRELQDIKGLLGAILEHMNGSL